MMMFLMASIIFKVVATDDKARASSSDQASWTTYGSNLTQPNSKLTYDIVKVASVPLGNGTVAKC